MTTNINETTCRWCKSAACTLKTSPECYCLDCGTRLSPCKCMPDCPGGNCYQPSCCTEDPDSAEYARKREELSKQLGRLTAMTWAQLEESKLSIDIQRKLAELRDTRPYDGRRVTLCENRGGWRYTGLSGICTRLSADNRRMALLVEHDPEDGWPLGMEILVELDHETRAQFFERHQAEHARASVSARYCQGPVIETRCLCYGCTVLRQRTGIVEPDRSAEPCEPVGACESHGRCWTHSTWTDESAAPGATTT